MAQAYSSMCGRPSAAASGDEAARLVIAAKDAAALDARAADSAAAAAE